MAHQKLKEKLLLIGPIDRYNRHIGGLSIGFNAFRSFLKKNSISYKLIDTRPYDGAFGTIANLINLVIRVLLYVPRCNVVLVYASYHGILYLYPPLYLLCRLLRTRFCFYPVGGDFLDIYHSRPFWHRTLIRNTLFKSDVLFLQTQHLLDHFKSFGVDAIWFPSGRIKPKGIPASRHYSRRFIFLSRVCPEKGIDIIKEALEELENFTIHVYGPLNSFDEELIRGWVNYKGTVLPPDVLDTLGYYDVLILPTVYPREGYPGVIIEAYSIGMPVIATDWMAIPEIVQHEVSGILIKPWSAKALANAIRSIDDDKYTRLCAGAREMFKKFDSDITFVKVLDKLLN
ncbi:glycosyltransferase [Nitrospira sp. MA-1]|nr:glycosyltransferase [Nitrospira sp. MA-1]